MVGSITELFGSRSPGPSFVFRTPTTVVFFFQNTPRSKFRLLLSTRQTTEAETVVGTEKARVFRPSE